jgi:hypothetical protein
MIFHSPRGLLGEFSLDNMFKDVVAEIMRAISVETREATGGQNPPVSQRKQSWEKHREGEALGMKL